MIVTAAATTIAAATASTAAVLIVAVTAGNALVRRYHIDDGSLCSTVSAAVLGVLVCDLGGRHLHLRLRALDVALLLGPISTATLASAMIVGECLQRASTEQQARNGQRGDDRQASGSGH
jgi:hypothetical protein